MILTPGSRPASAPARPRRRPLGRHSRRVPSFTSAARPPLGDPGPGRAWRRWRKENTHREATCRHHRRPARRRADFCTVTNVRRCGPVMLEAPIDDTETARSPSAVPCTAPNRSSVPRRTRSAASVERVVRRTCGRARHRQDRSVRAVGGAKRAMVLMLRRRRASRHVPPAPALKPPRTTQLPV